VEKSFELGRNLVRVFVVFDFVEFDILFLVDSLNIVIGHFFLFFFLLLYRRTKVILWDLGEGKGRKRRGEGFLLSRCFRRKWGGGGKDGFAEVFEGGLLYKAYSCIPSKLVTKSQGQIRKGTLLRIYLLI